MEDEAILLKIKRDFTENEAVQSLLKIVSALEIEIGVLKSEKHELQDKINKITNQGVKGKKLWMQDEVVALLETQLKHSKERQVELQKSVNGWQERYFALIVKQNK